VLSALVPQPTFFFAAGSLSIGSSHDFIFILNVNLPVILNGCTLCVRQTMGVTFARGRQRAIKGVLGVTTIGLRSLVAGAGASLALGENRFF
jgi:hypothetical protein